MRSNIHVVTVNTQEKADEIAKMLGKRYLQTLTYYINDQNGKYYKIGGYDVAYLENKN